MLCKARDYPRLPEITRDYPRLEGLLCKARNEKQRKAIEKRRQLEEPGVGGGPEATRDCPRLSEIRRQLEEKLAKIAKKKKKAKAKAKKAAKKGA